MKLLYTSLLSFVFVASTAFVVPRNLEVPFTPIVEASKVSDLPTLVGGTTFPVLSAQAVVTVDIDSGVTLYEKNPDLELLPASTTKIATALTAMDYYPKDSVLKVGKVRVEGQKMGLVAGEEIKLEDLLYGLLIYSGNDAAEVLADNYPGGRSAFMLAMNIKAKSLNLQNTSFTNPTGLEDYSHYSTARDMVRLSEVAMRDRYFAEIVGTKEKTVTSTNGKIIHRLKNINELLGEVEGVRGIKTGWTQNARENLITLVERDERKVLIALLGSQDRFGETKELINWVYGSYSWQPVTFPKLTLRSK